MQDKLAAISDLANGSKLNRILANPMGYLHLFIYKKINYPFSKKGSQKTCTTFFGSKMEVILPAGIDLFLTGAKTHDSEIRLAKFLINNLSIGDNFLDIGAHFGYFTLLASKLVGKSGQVHCIEASSEMFKVLSQNTKAHANISINNLAASDKKGTIEFYEFPILYSEYNSMDADQYKGASWFKKNAPKKIEVEAIAVDDFLSENNMHPKIIKIDVEGAEDKVIVGMIKFLEKSTVSFIAMEYIRESKNKIHFAAAKTLNNYNYQPHLITSDGKLSSIKLDEIDAVLKSKKIDSDNLIFKI